MTPADLLDRLAAANALVNAAIDLLPPHETAVASAAVQLDPFSPCSPASALVALRRADALTAVAVDALAATIERNDHDDH